ncbi:hypothetical protein [Aquimarina celericrescens]|uniref:Uncharacterized protein n=1 Tax=Aquimarina celericrescens TaxID=1964542 RepID=A0ABW5B068_9FLAO
MNKCGLLTMLTVAKVPKKYVSDSTASIKAMILVGYIGAND